jgi:hypothetical protein
VSRVHRLQHVQCLTRADLTDDDSIRSHPERVANQISDRESPGRSRDEGMGHVHEDEVPEESARAWAERKAALRFERKNPEGEPFDIRAAGHDFLDDGSFYFVDLFWGTPASPVRRALGMACPITTGHGRSALSLGPGVDDPRKPRPARDVDAGAAVLVQRELTRIDGLVTRGASPPAPVPSLQVGSRLGVIVTAPCTPRGQCGATCARDTWTWPLTVMMGSAYPDRSDSASDWRCCLLQDPSTGSGGPLDRAPTGRADVTS